MKGDVLNDVTASRGNRGFNSSGGDSFTFHTDVGDIAGLLCLEPALEGGGSQFVSAIKIHNVLLNEGVKELCALYQPIPFDARGEQWPGSSLWYELPVFIEQDNHLFSHFISSYISMSQE